MNKSFFSLLLAILLAIVPLTGCAELLSALPAPAAALPTAALTLAEEDPSQLAGTPMPALTLIGEDVDAPDGSAPQAGLTLIGDETLANTPKPRPTHTPAPAIDRDGAYTSRDDVALYLVTYGTLPDNFITKNEARALGWSGGGLDDYAYGKCIGGDHFGNYEGLLPEQSGRRYFECDIDTLHRRSRGAKRIIFSNDGLIYYTGDHYESFALLYGEE